jgi:AcrR family transcriptional regulator
MDPRAVRSRDALLAATLNLLADRPAESISATDVVNLAKVSRPTLYQHFGDLTSLIVAAVTSRLQALFDETLPGGSASDAEDLGASEATDRAAIDTLLEHLLAEADVFRHALHGSSGYPVMRELSVLLACRLTQHGPVHRALQAGHTPEHLARFMGHGAVGIVADWLDVPHELREPVPTVTRRLTRLLCIHVDAADSENHTDTTHHAHAEEA